MSLRKLITYMRGRWRLPDKGWTTDIDECSRRYEKEFEALGYDVASVYRTKGMEEVSLLSLHVGVVEVPSENMTGVINLVLTLEPESLELWGPWTSIAGLGTLVNLKELDLKNTRVSDLTPLKGLPNLKKLELQFSKVTDLTPLKGLPNLRFLALGNTKVSDLTPLKGMPNLQCLYLQNTKVTDLTPLKGLAELRILNLENTNVTDLTPLKGLPVLMQLNLRNTNVTDLTPLKGMPILLLIGNLIPRDRASVARG